MIYDCSKAYSVAIWFRKEPFEKQDSPNSWYMSSLEPSWFCYIPLHHELKNGDVILINKNTRLDFNRRINIKKETYILVNYCGDDTTITIKKVGWLHKVKKWFKL